MTTDKELRTYKFVKEETNKWYIDLPDWQGHKADLEMVEGADIMLDHVSNGATEVSLSLSEQPFSGADMLELKYDYSKQTGGGGIYFLKKYNGQIMNQEMWLCEVTEYVFGALPPVIYFKKA